MPQSREEIAKILGRKRAKCPAVVTMETLNEVLAIIALYENLKRRMEK